MRSGKVRYRVRVPQFSGALRVMAVAYKGRCVRGSPSTSMKRRRPGGHQHQPAPFLEPRRHD
ncbi:MAG: hypothetical protein WKG07_27590 [Hymenobacter sp.]